MAKKKTTDTPDRLTKIESRLLRLELIFEKEKRRLARETAVEPWRFLVRRQHPWRGQLYIKGRNLTARQLVGSIKANQWDNEGAAQNYHLPIEAIEEALAYVEQNMDLLKTEAEIERLMRKRKGSPVSLNLYLDDCSNSDLLADLLRQAGHRVVRPADADGGLTGEDDDIHFAFAAANDLAIITKNPSDFQQLHDLEPHHSGILAVYQDNDPSRDMSDAEIVTAINNLKAAAQSGGEPIQGKFHSLNDWRY